MKPSVYAPMYCAMYPDLSDIARKHGYAMAVHGSVARDFDLICIPWAERPSDPVAVVNEITSTFAVKKVGEPDTAHHGRERWTITVGFGECFIDLSFMPRVEQEAAQVGAKAEELLALIDRYASKRATHAAIEATRIAVERQPRGPRGVENTVEDEANSLRYTIEKKIRATATNTNPGDAE